MNDRGGASGHFARIILAAGQSKRMGQAKALLPFGHQNVIERVLEAGRSVAGLAVVVVNPHLREALADAGGLEGVELVENADPASEQIDSLKLGIERLEALSSGLPDGFFIHPVDYPLVGEEDYQALARELGQGEGYDVFQPACRQRHGHPVLCRYSLARNFLELPAGGTARDVIRKARVGYVAVSNPGVVEDMDTPADYSRLLELAGGEEPS